MFLRIYSSALQARIRPKREKNVSTWISTAKYKHLISFKLLILPIKQQIKPCAKLSGESQVRATVKTNG